MKKSTTIRLWLIIIALTVLGFWLVSRLILDHAQVVENINHDCAKNIKYSKSWQKDLQKYGIDEKAEGLALYYCRCTIGDPLKSLSKKEMDTFINLSPEDRMAKLGGKKGMAERNTQCLQSWQKKPPPLQKD